MDSTIFNYFGIGWVDPAVIFIFLIVFIVILLALLILSFQRIKALEKRMEGFFEGEDARSLENEIRSLFGDIRNLKRDGKNAEENIKTLFVKCERSVQKVGLVKYDAFREMGGSLSFALCLLNETDNGFVMNSVHSSGGSYVYIKEILDGKSKIELGNEEKSALSMALKGAQTIEYKGEWDKNDSIIKSKQIANDLENNEHENILNQSEEDDENSVFVDISDLE